MNKFIYIITILQILSVKTALKGEVNLSPNNQKVVNNINNIPKIPQLKEGQLSSQNTAKVPDLKKVLAENKNRKDKKRIEFVKIQPKLLNDPDFDDFDDFSDETNVNNTPEIKKDQFSKEILFPDLKKDFAQKKLKSQKHTKKNLLDFLI